MWSGFGDGTAIPSSFWLKSYTVGDKNIGRLGSYELNPLILLIHSASLIPSYQLMFPPDCISVGFSGYIGWE